MTRYRVYLTCTISTSVDVEAESEEDALDSVYDSDGMPGGVAFLNHTFPDMGEWVSESAEVLE